MVARRARSGWPGPLQLKTLWPLLLPSCYKGRRGAVCESFEHTMVIPWLGAFGVHQRAHTRNINRNQSTGKLDFANGSLWAKVYAPWLVLLGIIFC